MKKTPKYVKQFLVAKDKFTGEQRTFTFEVSLFGEMLVVEETTKSITDRIKDTMKAIKKHPNILKDKKMKKLYNRIIEYSGIN